MGSVEAAQKVSPNWSQETMTCHSSYCFSIVWGEGNAPLVTPLPSSCYIPISLICNKQGVALSALTVPTSGSAVSRQAAEL